MSRVVLLFAALVIIGPARPISAEYITSDTLDYCHSLADKMQAAQEIPADARVLLIEGRAMCEHGHVVGGLRRLRLAMLIMHSQANTK
jgi:hypothetical protein